VIDGSSKVVGHLYHKFLCSGSSGIKCKDRIHVRVEMLKL
jgi:hypothetical protein